MKRIDLQLIEMIKDAQRLFRNNDVQIRDRVFIHGFSASGTFANRFAILHPRIVKAVVAGGINCIPTFPTNQWHGILLRYPVGIADLKEIAGIDFNEKTYKQVSQYIYMGYLDRNNTIPYGHHSLVRFHPAATSRGQVDSLRWRQPVQQLRRYLQEDTKQGRG